MPVTNQLKNHHLMWRAGFGPMAEDFTHLSTANPSAYVNALFKASAKNPAYIDVVDNAIKGLMMGVEEVGKQQARQLSDAEKKKLREQSKEDIKSLNLTWLSQMVNSDQQLREKMSLFWHGHFASRNLNILYQQQYLDIIRKNALGNFGDLLRGISKSAAMINFLNNNQNRKDHPNENFAREVMELFTLGRGNYTENDIKEAARAFTGWGARLNGEFVFRKFQHDEGKKTILSKTGNFDGDDVLDILLDKPQTAIYITRKVYRYFVNDRENENHIGWLAARFLQSGYDISSLMKDIFSSSWFYDEKNIGAKIKSPVELIVGMQRVLPMQWQNPEVQLLLQRLLGQILFFPPNVAGWPGGQNWIDSSSLMLRLRLPQMLYAAGELNEKPKDDDDQMMGIKDGRMKNAGKLGGQMIQASIDWKMYTKKYESVSRDSLLAAITGKLLQTPASISEDLLKKYTDSSSRENFIKSVTIQIMSTPEYQLC